MTDRDVFQDLTERHRPALHLHCYRMLGSLHDAEDCVQETYLRAWTGFAQYTGAGAARGWLYRIATNTCLNALSRRARTRRVLPEVLGPPAHGMPMGGAAMEISWLEPYPDRLWESVADAAPGPHARYEMRESVELAFIAAIQYLPARQRAALLLCDVLGWPASETAALLEASTTAVNSALQRARATLAKSMPAEQRAVSAPSASQNALLDRYMEAWEIKDLDKFAAVLREDAVLSMPPWTEWYFGKGAIRAFISWAWTSKSYGAFRLVQTSANGRPAFAIYVRGKEPDAPWRPHSIQVLDIQDNTIAKITTFVPPTGAGLFPAFGMGSI
ncbi:MAG: polymerase subunit sigma-70 [Capsulimonas sp.]|nr:polymerase subunit sigma-70 [Capsulimonas sp.]